MLSVTCEVWCAGATLPVLATKTTLIGPRARWRRTSCARSKAGRAVGLRTSRKSSSSAASFGGLR
eukprot:8860316-Alexandrium_andersonii.AAC.1